MSPSFRTNQGRTSEVHISVGYVSKHLPFPKHTFHSTMVITAMSVLCNHWIMSDITEKFRDEVESIEPNHGTLVVGGSPSSNHNVASLLHELDVCLGSVGHAADVVALMSRDIYPCGRELDFCILVRCKIPLTPDEQRMLSASAQRFEMFGDEVDFNELRRLRPDE